VIQIQRIPEDDLRSGSRFAPVVADTVAWIRYVLPRGGSLPSEIWERRHRGVIVLLLEA
jgi:hypothetical protein